MVKAKILYDEIIRTKQEWEKYLINFYDNSASLGLTETQYFEAIQSHYFAVLHNNPLEIKSRIIQHIKAKIGENSIVEDKVLEIGRNSMFYRISTPIQIVIEKDKIFYGKESWKRCRDLHNKKLVAISNLISRLEKEI